MLLSYLFYVCSFIFIYFSVLESISLLKGSFCTCYITILYRIHNQSVLIIYLYYISKINIID